MPNLSPSPRVSFSVFHFFFYIYVRKFKQARFLRPSRQVFLETRCEIRAKEEKMKVSLNWLRRHVDLPENAEEVAKALTSIGLEVKASLW